jgi:hypothetical protein
MNHRSCFSGPKYSSLDRKTLLKAEVQPQTNEQIIGQKVNEQ